MRPIQSGVHTSFYHPSSDPRRCLCGPGRSKTLLQSAHELQCAKTLTKLCQTSILIIQASITHERCRFLFINHPQNPLSATSPRDHNDRTARLKHIHRPPAENDLALDRDRICGNLEDVCLDFKFYRSACCLLRNYARIDT
ncbi:MAG: hypothetical protein C5S48_08425 [Candidatus Methanogaster sp.]|nr:MAG: hypothetical protein C5S48_08425 [ANME-2 cluster archaeon]